MPIRYFFFFVAMIFAVFGNTYISDYIGYTMRTTVAFILLLLYCLFKYFKGECCKKTDMTYKWMIIIGMTIIVVHSLLDHDYTQNMLTMIFIPCIFYLFFTRLDSQEKNIVTFAMILFFIANSLMAIWEHYNTAYFIKHEVSKIDSLESWSFRARAMLGHPLANALIMSTTIIYILASDLNFKSKLALFALGEYALLCFNTRSGLLATTICAIPLIFDEIKKQKKTYRKYYYIFIFCIGVIAVSYIINNEIGGRLVNISLNEGFLSDNSSRARLEILDFTNYLNSSDLLLGNPDSYERLLIVMKIMGIENGIITIILYYGLLLGIPLTIILIRFYWKRLRLIGKKQCLCILCCFWSIGLTNPHIAYSLAWYYFFFGYFAFIPVDKYSLYKKINL